MRRFLKVLAAATALGIGSVAAADPITDYSYQLSTYQVITSGEPSATGSQIQVYLKDNGGTSVTFHVENIGTFTDSVTEMYFQDGKWLSTSGIGITSSNTVKWETTATPDSLPGGDSATPPFTTDISLDSQAVQQGSQMKNGINNNSSNPYVQGDWVDVTFNYLNGINFQSVLAGLNAPQAADRLEMGFHVTGYNSSASVVESGTTPVVGNPPTPTETPLPSSAAAGLLLLGACGAAAHLRKRGFFGSRASA